ncbi:hypothetical protein OAE40_00585 [Rubripirellula sp.]|nr:hypothetical protein [Rubripirellula sp.]MDB4654251.1 hypothetical protein [Rubripirellula sp.]
MKTLFSVAILTAASLIGMNPAAATEATVNARPVGAAPVPELATMHVPKKYSRSAAIAKARAKYPGYTLSHVRELTNVWVVVLKK